MDPTGHTCDWCTKPATKAKLVRGSAVPEFGGIFYYACLDHREQLEKMPYAKKVRMR
jgi:hypothetical protein